MPDFANIPMLPTALHEVDVEWRYFEHQLASWAKLGLDMNPDYQREHVWTETQQIAYTEYVLRGGEVGKSITWNCTTWDTDYSTPIELVDGKQRLEAVRKFLRGDLPVFGHRYPTWTGHLRIHARFQFRVCCLKTREEILQLYLNINAGGTPHTAAELDRVRALLAAETRKSLT